MSIKIDTAAFVEHELELFPRRHLLLRAGMGS